MGLKRRDMVSIGVLLLAIVLLVLVILGMSGAVDLCRAGAIGRKKQRSGKSKKEKKSKKTKQGKAAKKEEGVVAVPADTAGAAASGAKADYLSMQAPAALEALKDNDPPAVLFVLGQSSCPACQACKKYLSDNNHGDVSLFIDIAAHPNTLKDGSLPKAVVDSLGRGVPCMVGWHRKGKGKLGSKEGFSPKAVEELIALVRQG